MIFDDYTARYRALQAGQPEDPRADEQLTNDAARRAADAAIADVDRLSKLIDREVPLCRHLHSLADVAQAAGVRVTIEHHPLPSPPPDHP